MKTLSRGKIAFICGLLAFSTPASAQVIAQTQQLTFGTVVAASVGGDRELVLGPNGNIISIDSGLYALGPLPEAGEYSFTGGTPNRDYVVSFNNSILLVNGGNSTFTIDDFVAQPPTIHTDGLGDATFSVGGTLTAINGGTYGNGNYDGDLEITLTIVP